MKNTRKNTAHKVNRPALQARREDVMALAAVLIIFVLSSLIVPIRTLPSGTFFQIAFGSGGGGGDGGSGDGSGDGSASSASDGSSAGVGSCSSSSDACSSDSGVAAGDAAMGGGDGPTGVTLSCPPGSSLNGGMVCVPNPVPIACASNVGQICHLANSCGQQSAPGVIGCDGTCGNKYETSTLTPSGHYLGTYDDFRNGPSTVCSSLVGKTMTAGDSYACAPDLNIPGYYAGSGDSSTYVQPVYYAESRHNGSWGVYANGQGWCESTGVEWVQCGPTIAAPPESSCPATTNTCSNGATDYPTCTTPDTTTTTPGTGGSLTGSITDASCSTGGSGVVSGTISGPSRTGDTNSNLYASVTAYPGWDSACDPSNDSNCTPVTTSCVRGSGGTGSYFNCPLTLPKGTKTAYVEGTVLNDYPGRQTATAALSGAQTMTCTAAKTVVSGVCGSANGAKVSSAPSGTSACSGSGTVGNVTTNYQCTSGYTDNDPYSDTYGQYICTTYSTTAIAGYSWTCTPTVTSTQTASAVGCSATYAAPTKPDLTAGNITPTSVPIGKAVTLTAAVTNLNAVATGKGFTDLFQIATDAQGTGAADIGTYDSAALGASGSNTASLSYTFPSAGTYYLRACADKAKMADTTGVIAESDENNNCSPQWVAVTASNSSITGSCSVSPASGFVGDTFTWSATASGGNGAYAYSWSGTDNLSGDGSPVTKTYASIGTKTASVVITSGSDTSTIDCSGAATVTNCYGQGCAPGPGTPGAGGPGTSGGGGCTYTSSSQPTVGTPNECCSPTPGVCPEKPTVVLSADSNAVDVGQHAYFNWTSNYATECHALGTPAAFDTKGATQHSSPGVPSAAPLTQTPSTSFIISCSGPGGFSTDAKSIAVLNPAVSITADPLRVAAAPNNATTVSWSAKDVSRCDITRNGVAWKSSLTGAGLVNSASDTVNGQVTYLITCETNGAPVKQSVTVNSGPLFQEF